MVELATSSFLDCLFSDRFPDRQPNYIPHDMEQRGPLDTFRRRGQGLSPNLAASPDPQVLYSPRTPSLLSSPEDHGTAFDLDPNVASIVLVASKSSSHSLSGLPDLPSIHSTLEYRIDDSHSSIVRNDESRSSSPFRCDSGPDSSLGRTLSQRSEASADSLPSLPPSLPTPDFDGDGGSLTDYVRPLLSMNLQDSTSFKHLNRNIARLVSDHVQSQAPLQRADSEHSDSTTVASSTTSLSDKYDDQSTLSVGAHPKLTQKWPRPRSVRSATGGKRKGRVVSSTLSSVEGGRGLGVDFMGRWTVHKWVLVLSICTVLTYGLVAMMFSLRTWFKTWLHADAFIITDGDLLILMTLAASIMVFTAMVGFTGAILNSRPILAVYCLLLWPAFTSMLVVGYISYKRYAFALDQKLSLAWSQYYTDLGRLVIQESLNCCGYYSPAHDAVPSTKCYIRTLLPGCKSKLFRMERENLASMWGATFALVPLHLLNIAISLLCSNHVTKTFGKGITPKLYRLTIRDVQESQAQLGEPTKVNLSRPVLSRFTSRSTFREDKRKYTFSD